MYLLVITTVFCCGFCKCKAPLKGKGNRMQFYRLHMKKKKKKKWEVQGVLSMTL